MKIYSVKKSSDGRSIPLLVALAKRIYALFLLSQHFLHHVILYLAAYRGFHTLLINTASWGVWYHPRSYGWSPWDDQGLDPTSSLGNCQSQREPWGGGGERLLYIIPMLRLPNYHLIETWSMVLLVISWKLLKSWMQTLYRFCFNTEPTPAIYWLNDGTAPPVYDSAVGVNTTRLLVEIPGAFLDGEKKKKRK